MAALKTDMTQPCAECPFRKGTPLNTTLGRARLLEFAESEEFVCHKTADGEEGSFKRRDDGSTQWCAGHLALREKLDKPTQMMRIYERLGMYDARRICKPETFALVSLGPAKAAKPARKPAQKGRKHGVRKAR